MSKLIRFFSLAIIIFPLTVNFSCSKKGGTPVTKTTLITALPWKISDAGLDPEGDGVINSALPAPFELLPCIKDNLLTFKADKTGMMDEGATKCNSTDAQSTAFTWDFANNNTELTTSKDIFPVGFPSSINVGPKKITELSETKLTLSITVSGTVPGIPFPINSTVTVLLVH